jgi:PilZ domain
VGALAWKIVEPAQVERRHDQRVEVRLLGRFMRSDRKEFDCESIDASPYGIAFSSDAGVQPNERIVAYLNQIGRVEGRVARIFPGGFAIQMNVPPAKRDKLNSQLTTLADRQSRGLPDDRRHDRIAPRDRYTILKLANGREYTATLIDISMSGAALNVDCEPPIGARVVSARRRPRSCATSTAASRSNSSAPCRPRNSAKTQQSDSATQRARH